MQGLKFRKTNIVKIVKESLSKFACPGRIAVSVKSMLDDETVWIDHEQMVGILTDLVQNAVEAMPEKGMLTVIVAGDEQQVILKIMDTGKGISEENLPLLFTPFYTTKPAGDGTGLGLPQAFSTIKAHSGDISITSNADPGKGPTGTEIKITLPRRQTFQAKETKIFLHEEEPL